ncbi:MAG TPA: radical SAM protein [Sandaracinaceae bacterium]
MHVTFVALGQEQLAISLLSAILRDRGHTTSLVFDPALFHDRWYFDVPYLRDFFSRDDAVVDEIVALEPDLVAFSVLTPMYTWSVDIARRVKERVDVPVIFGGVHPSAVPEVCLEEDAVDYVCVGEGDEALPALARALEGRPGAAVRPDAPIPNLWWRGKDGAIVRGPSAPFLEDLDSLPLPDRHLWEDVVRFEDNAMIAAGRGCPYRCTFCFNNYFAELSEGRFVRQRSVESVIDEMARTKARYGVRHFEIVDDILTLNKRWMREFLSRYEREIAVPFSCLVHPRFIDDEVACWLRDAGCDRVQMGIQSADAEYKRKQLLRMEKEPHVERALEAMSRAGLRMKLDHIFGLPGEPLGAQEKAAELFRRFPPARINTYWLSYLPGTEMKRAAVEAGVISPEESARIDRGLGRTFHHGNRADLQASLGVYRRYELLFRMIPLLPRPLLERVRAEHLPELEGGAADAIGFALDAIAALLQGDSETWTYGRHYLHHLKRAAMERARGRALPTRAPRPVPPVAYPPRGRKGREPRRLAIAEA